MRNMGWQELLVMWLVCGTGWNNYIHIACRKKGLQSAGCSSTLRRPLHLIA